MDAARSSGAHALSAARKVLVVPEIPDLASGKTGYVGLKALAEHDTYKRLLPAATGQEAGKPMIEIDSNDQTPGSEPTRAPSGTPSSA